MLLKPATDGSITGTGTFVLESTILGGVLITADGTNAATVIVRYVNSSGKQIFKLVTKSPIFITGPLSNRDGGNTSQTAYYDVSGTGGAAQFYEWVT